MKQQTLVTSFAHDDQPVQSWTDATTNHKSNDTDKMHMHDSYLVLEAVFD
jgi:hypothetical protein